MSALRVGQAVVCVDAGGSCGRLVQGATYRVAGFGSLRPHGGHSSTLIIDGVPHPHVDWGWIQSRFRPVKTTSIEIFKAMLSPAPEKEMV